MIQPPREHEVVVVGAGLCGLGVAVRVQDAGPRVTVLERADEPAAAWAVRYPALRLNTTARLSAQPGLSFPRAAGRWPSRDDVIAYAARYVAHHRLDVRYGVEVCRIDARPERLVVRVLGGEDLLATAVVVATGHDRVPVMPAWPGIEGFQGGLMHAAMFDRAEDFRDHDVLLVGAGMSAGDLARLLVAAGARVTCSMRTPPNLYPAQLLGVPLQPLAYHARNLPAPVLDRTVAAAARLAFGDLTRHGLAKPPAGVETTWRRTGRTPLRDDGFVAAVKTGRIEIVAPIERLAGPDVLLADGRRLTPDVVIAATGYRPGLEPLVGHLGVLAPDGTPAMPPGREHPAAPGLHFAGMLTPNAGGLALSARVHGPRIARAVTRRVNHLQRDAHAHQPLRHPRPRPAAHGSQHPRP
jgi:putative flavoprotein involved in K+ transport